MSVIDAVAIQLGIGANVEDKRAEVARIMAGRRDHIKMCGPGCGLLNGDKCNRRPVRPGSNGDRCPRCKGRGRQGKDPANPTAQSYRLPTCNACAGKGTREAFDEHKRETLSQRKVVKLVGFIRATIGRASLTLTRRQAIELYRDALTADWTPGWSPLRPRAWAIFGRRVGEELIQSSRKLCRGESATFGGCKLEVLP